MEPTLVPGDWLLVDPHAYIERSPSPGELVLVPDPRQVTRLLVKRVTSVDPDGWLRLGGDAPEASTDSRAFGSVDPNSVVGRPWYRYFPPRRVGRIR